MTNSNQTLIAALLDRSGSMEECRAATESGFDELIATQRAVAGEVHVTLSMFDDVYETVYANLPIAQVPPLNLLPRNMTAMLDAIGRFITKVGEHLAAQDEPERPDTVLCLIMTDGYENASREWTYTGVKTLITQQREQYGWQFIFLGANIDAVHVGEQIGVPQATSMTYSPDAVATTYTRAAREMTSARAGSPMGFTDEDRFEAGGGSS
jgi:hypothetical protein